ncbi:MAG TPA: hypothetical protein VGL46_11145 [Pseudonocardiaceae bacterium]|jgi:hypothetical protein
MNAGTERCQQDAAVLRKAVRLLDGRNSADLHLPGRSTEFVLFETARLLEAIASSLERGDPVAHDVLENAERFARHIHRYSDVYLPAKK